MNWVPGPIRAPSPSRNSGTSGPSIPPRRDSTIPERRFTTRRPAWRARCAAASQSLTRSARNPVPAGAYSSTSRVPVSPYQPTAEPDSSTEGGLGAFASAATSDRVLSIRLARSSRLRACVHRPPASGAPDRWTTAPTPSNAAGSTPPSAAPGLQRTSPGCRAGRRTSQDDPVIATRITPPLQPEFGLERPLFEPGLQRDQEPGGVCPIDQPMVVGEGQVDHGPHGDDLAERRVLHDHGPLDDGTGAEDAHLRLIDDRRIEQRPAAAGVGQGEGAARQLVR